MPFGISTGAAILAGGAISAGGAIAAGSMQSDAVNGASKTSQRIAEENRVVNNQNLQNTLAAVGPRLEAAGDRSNAAITNAQTQATEALAPSYALANQRLLDGAKAADARYAGAQDIIGNGVTSANALLDPYVQTGQRALHAVGDLSGANGVEAGRAAMDNFQYSPAYQFNLDQGLRAVDAGASARGMLVSGGAKTAEMKYASGLASNEFANYYSRLNDLSKQGYTASQQTGANDILGANAQAGYEAQRGTTALNVAGMQGSNDINLGNALGSNAMTTGGRLAQNEQQTGVNISNLYTGNASQVTANNNNAANNMSQTAASAGSAQASIYGNMAGGVTSAINSGMNNYVMMNALAPQAAAAAAPPPVAAPTYGGIY